MKALLLRVGIDKGSGGCLAPIFQDSSFEYIPIHETEPSSQRISYKTYAGRNYDSILPFLPPKLHNSTPHLDPEFKTFTYGDPTRKHAVLSKLTPGDLLVFYAGLVPYPRLKIDVPRLYMIGYFTVKEVYSFNQIPRSEHKRVLKRLLNNAHTKRLKLDKNLVVIKGMPRKSKLFTKAIPLGDASNNILRYIGQIFGVHGSILRAVPRRVNNSNIPKLKRWMRTGIPLLLNDWTRLFSYVLKSDTGFSPNVTGGYCTLACCKPKIRKAAREGDWVMGTLPKKFGPNRLAYIMRISEILTFDQFYSSQDSRFRCKKPQFDLNGDNIYYRKNGRFVQIPNAHHGSKHKFKDTRSDQVLISDLFWYFGGSGPELPSRLRKGIIKEGQAHYKIEDTKVIKSLVSFICRKYRPGVLGPFRDGHANRKSRKRFHSSCSHSRASD